MQWFQIDLLWLFRSTSVQFTTIFLLKNLSRFSLIPVLCSRDLSTTRKQKRQYSLYLLLSLINVELKKIYPLLFGSKLNFYNFYTFSGFLNLKIQVFSSFSLHVRVSVLVCRMSGPILQNILYLLLRPPKRALKKFLKEKPE